MFLNACQTGSGGRRHFNKGVAQSLVSHGVPDVAANQYSVLDTSATSFAQHFYWALADGMSVGQAARGADCRELLDAGGPHRLGGPGPVRSRSQHDDLRQNRAELMKRIPKEIDALEARLKAFHLQSPQAFALAVTGDLESDLLLVPEPPG